MTGSVHPDDTRDIERVLQTLQQARIEDHEVESLVHGASQPMLILDGEGRVLTVNTRAEALLDRDARSLRGSSFASALAPASREDVQRHLREAARTRQGPSDLETEIETKAGVVAAVVTFLPFVASRRTRVALLVREADGPAMRRLEARLAESEAKRGASEERITRDQKLTELGRLVSGIAHEIKSPVAYIENLAHLTESRARRLEAAHPELASEIGELRANVETMREGAQRIRHILQGLRPLTGNRAARPQPVDLAVLVADAVRTFQGSARDVRTEIVLDLQATHHVLLDIEEMSRVVLNLLQNASEAMGGAGRVVIRTRNRDGPPQIRVEDGGPGVPEGARLFEPFYTTKKEGTGLGLAISQRIVAAHGGVLRHERGANGGATFVVEFPR